MPFFRTPEERASYMVDAGIAVDEATAMMIGEAEPGKLFDNEVNRGAVNNSCPYDSEYSKK